MLHINLSLGATTVSQLVADVPSEHTLAPPHEIKNKLKARPTLDLSISSGTHFLGAPDPFQKRESFKNVREEYILLGCDAV
jgi:hypothetical protein